MFQQDNSIYKLDNLLNQINILRKELITIASKEGFNSDKTILISQKLDDYIYQYQYYKKVN
ncbi:MAG TPA: aspartyl-phosphate phosphatase Spo0E family protein [Niallia sp.]|nr:aspartyl-phosphate phosphatase Spo0E family protein [Niallia sp.]